MGFKESGKVGKNRVTDMPTPDSYTMYDARDDIIGNFISTFLMVVVVGVTMTFMFMLPAIGLCAFIPILLFMEIPLLCLHLEWGGD